MLDKYRKIIKNDPETKDLELSDVDVLKVYEYIKLRDSKKDIDGYVPILQKDPYIEIKYMPTKEKENELNRKKMLDYLNYFDSEVYLQDVYLKDFDIFNKERQKAYDLAVDFINNYKKGKNIKGLYIYGKYATGKTYLLSAIAQELARKEVNVLFVFMPDLVRSIKQGMTDGDLEQRVNKLKQADVLMIDDIGGENITPWFRDEILLPIIQYRLSAKLPVFFSSNLEMPQLMEAFSISRVSEYDMTKAIRLIQRIRDLTIYVKLNDEQYK